MAPLPVIPSCFRVAFNWVTVSGLNATNVMHFQGGGDSDDLMDAILAATSDPGPDMFGTVSSEARVSTVVITPLDGESASTEYTIGPGSTLVGTAPADYNPQVAAIVKITTLKRGRSYRGRVYLPFVSEGAQAEGAIPSTTVAADAAAWGDFATNMLGEGWFWVVASYTLGTAEVVTAVTFEGRTATQRRRQVR